MAESSSQFATSSDYVLPELNSIEDIESYEPGDWRSEFVSVLP